MSVRWRRTALPLSYGRVHRAGLEPAKPKAPDLQSGLVAAWYLCVNDGAGDS